MAEGSGAKGAPHPFTDEELSDLGPDEELSDPGLDDPRVLAWTEKHLPELRRSAYGQRLLYQSLDDRFQGQWS
jgi:aryl carrier-like protein